MTPEIVLWILSGAAVPLIGWGIQLTWVLHRVREDAKLLVTMHREPEKYGFGSNATNEELQDLIGVIKGELLHQVNDVIRANTRAIQSLTHYVKWMGEFNCPLNKEEGQKPHPPPPLGAEVDPNL
jgi:hypothetical protein